LHVKESSNGDGEEDGGLLGNGEDEGGQEEGLGLLPRDDALAEGLGGRKKNECSS
jgi:hypothetical protein